MSQKFQAQKLNKADHKGIKVAARITSGIFTFFISAATILGTIFIKTRQK